MQCDTFRHRCTLKFSVSVMGSRWHTEPAWPTLKSAGRADDNLNGDVHTHSGEHFEDWQTLCKWGSRRKVYVWVPQLLSQLSDREPSPMSQTHVGGVLEFQVYGCRMFGFSTHAFLCWLHISESLWVCIDWSLVMVNGSFARCESSWQRAFLCFSFGTIFLHTDLTLTSLCSLQLVVYISTNSQILIW